MKGRRAKKALAQWQSRAQRSEYSIRMEGSHAHAVAPRDCLRTQFQGAPGRERICLSKVREAVC